MPTMMLFKDGKKISEVVGANVGALEASLKQNLA